MGGSGLKGQELRDMSKGPSWIRGVQGEHSGRNQRETEDKGGIRGGEKSGGQRSGGSPRNPEEQKDQGNKLGGPRGGDAKG